MKEERKDREREKEEREKQITVTAGPFWGIISNYSYRRASAGELILHYITVGPSPGIRKCNNYCRNGTSSTSVPQDSMRNDSTACPEPHEVGVHAVEHRELHDSEQTDDKNKDINPALGIRSHDLPVLLEDFPVNP